MEEKYIYEAKVLVWKSNRYLYKKTYSDNELDLLEACKNYIEDNSEDGVGYVTIKYKKANTFANFKEFAEYKFESGIMEQKFHL